MNQSARKAPFEEPVSILKRILIVAVTLINIILSYIVSAPEIDDFVTLLMFSIGTAVALPLVILLLSQISSKNRNLQSRVKAFYWTSLLVLFGQMSACYQMVSKAAQDAG